MPNFDYCIWFLPENNSEFYNYTKGFSPHLTIKSKINKNDIMEFQEFINMIEDYKIKIKLVGNLYQTQEDYFYALQYNVQILDQDIPKWWPKNAHISFRYKYHLPYTKSEIEQIEKEIKVREVILDKIQIVYCNGDYSNWKRVGVL